MKYYLEDLAIEITRKCNMNCAHCLRGDAQNIDICIEYIDKLLDGVSSIGHVTFTGGEPSLNVAAMEYTLEQCKKRNITVGSFYVVTNGKANPLGLIMTCLKWYAYCDDYDEISGISMSKDMFHDEVPDEHEQLLRGLSFFRDDKFTDFENVRLLNEGRARELSGFRKSELYEKSDMEIDTYDDEICVRSMVYLSANGDIKTDCNLAYDNNDYTIGNIGLESLDYIIQTQLIEQTGQLPI